MNTKLPFNEPPSHGSWYKYGVGVLLLEMAVAGAVSAYSLYMTFYGPGWFPGKH